MYGVKPTIDYGPIKEELNAQQIKVLQGAGIFDGIYDGQTLLGKINKHAIQMNKEVLGGLEPTIIDLNQKLMGFFTCEEISIRGLGEDPAQETQSVEGSVVPEGWTPDSE